MLGDLKSDRPRASVVLVVVGVDVGGGQQRREAAHELRERVGGLGRHGDAARLQRGEGLLDGLDGDHGTLRRGTAHRFDLMLLRRRRHRAERAQRQLQQLRALRQQLLAQLGEAVRQPERLDAPLQAGCTRDCSLGAHTTTLRLRLSYGSVWGEARAVVAAVGVELLDSARHEVVRVGALVPLGGLGDDQQRPRGQAAR
eukprot:scaffold77155_cov66-Phaeocystis_antarctica.AAC.2